MPLISRIPPVHSIQEFRAAAGMRYAEGRRSALAGDRLAAIYFWGYVAEMLLKAAFFRLTGWLPAQPITLHDRKPFSGRKPRSFATRASRTPRLSKNACAAPFRARRGRCFRKLPRNRSGSVRRVGKWWTIDNVQLRIERLW